MPEIRIGQYLISDVSGPYIIAEIGVNHEGSLEKAKRLIELAHQGGANAAKFQTYKAERIASRHSPSYWDTSKEPTTSQFELFQKYDVFNANEYRMLAEHCAAVGIDFMSTPFDLEAVEFLEPLVPCFKIASADLTNIPLLRSVARKGKPVLLSTGASTLPELKVAIAELTKAGCSSLALLHCILNYPTEQENAHLGMIRGLRMTFPQFVIGYSDHTVPDEDMLATTTAFTLGARIIEKHFTHDKTLPGNDHYHAMDVTDCGRLISRIDRVRCLIGGTDKKAPIPTEEISRLNARRSLVLSQDVPAGSVLTPELLICKRPGTGISPLHFDAVIGRRVLRQLHADDVLHWDDLHP